MLHPEIIEQNFNDSATLLSYLQQAESLLEKANTLAQHLKKQHPNLDEFASNVADSFHYCTEALNQIEGINEALLPNMQQAHIASASPQKQ